MDNESLYIYGATLMMVIGTFSCRELPLRTSLPPFSAR